MICTAAASLSSRRLRSAARPLAGALHAQPVEQRGQPEPVAVGGLVQHLRDVREVGQVPLAALPGRAPARPMPAHLRGLEDRGHARARGRGRPSRAACRPTRSVSASPPAARLCRGLAEEHRGRRGPHQPAAVRLLERLEQAQPVRGRRRGEDVGVAGVDGGDAASASASRQTRASRCASTITATSPARTGRPSYVAPPASSGLDVGGEVAGDVVAERVHRRSCCGAGERRTSRGVTTRSRNGASVRRAGQPVVPGGARRRRAPRCPRGRARRRASTTWRRVDQRLVAAPVGAEGAPARSAVSRGLEVGRDVAAAEGVDGLLGVADEHHAWRGRRRPRRCTCHCTGSVSWNSSTITIRQRRRIRSRAGASGVLEGGGQPGQQVVVAEDAEPALAALELGEHRRGRSRPGPPAAEPGSGCSGVSGCAGCRPPRGPARARPRG